MKASIALKPKEVNSAYGMVFEASFAFSAVRSNQYLENADACAMQQEGNVLICTELS